jgi:hypothetical protein
MKNRKFTLVLYVLMAALPLTIGQASADTITSDHAVKIDPDQPFPSIMYSDILKSMSDQVMWEKGQLRFFERVRMTFLPNFQDPQHIAAYNPNTGAFLVSQLRDAGGNVVSTVFWEARQDRFPYWTATAVNNSDPAPLPPGDYTLTWSIDGADFWSLAFSVSTAPSENVYDPPNHYLDGPWNDWAYIYVPNGNLSQNPTFNLFLRDKKANPGSWVETNIEVEIFRNGELVAQHGKNNASRQSAKPWWIAQELALRAPDDSGFVSANDIVADGDYTVVVRMNGETYAEYEYHAEGELLLTGRQDRDEADPLEYLEGGQDRFYIERK